jgi:hypothetical protein
VGGSGARRGGCACRALGVGRQAGKVVVIGGMREVVVVVPGCQVLRWGSGAVVVVAGSRAAVVMVAGCSLDRDKREKKEKTHLVFFGYPYRV